MAGFTEISPTQLMRLIGGPTAPQIVDVITDEDFNEDPFLIPTAFRHNHTALQDLKERLGNGPIVVVCQKGLKLSHGVAAHLRAAGFEAQVLQGGNYGWRDAKLPRIPAQAIKGLQQGGTLWVTRHRPKIDRIACPWLIRRFVDPAAQFLFVPPAQVQGVAEKFGAIPFDVEDVPWSHEGDKCTFDTMIKRFNLSHDALENLALIVRAADTNNNNNAPQAAGLLAISVGLSKLYKDDIEQLHAGMTLYDALYRWARDGVNETHDWPVAR